MIEDAGGGRVRRAVEELLAFAREAEPGALPDLLSALGRFRCPGLAQEIAGLADHPQAEVRLVVAQALNQQSDASSPAVAALVRLSADTVEEVRSWATFALAGDHFHDVPGVDEALRARLTDLSPDVRVEAIRGLGRNGDAAVVEAALDLAPGRADDPVYLDAVSQLTVRFSPMLLVCPF